MGIGLRSAWTGLFLGGMMTLSSTGHAADIHERTIKFAFVQQKDNHWGAGAEKFAELVKQKSDGKITIKLFPGGTLGGDIAMLSSLQGGTVEMTMMGSGLLVGMTPEYVLFDLPFLFNSPQEADAILDGPVGTSLMAKLPDKGLVGLAYWEHGFRSLTNSRHPVARWEDVDGLKIRVIQAPLYIDIFNTLGANAVPMPLPELYTALETGTVDGQENPLVSIQSSTFYEVQKYLSTTRHVYNPIIVLYGKQKWDELSADEQQLLIDAANEVKPFQRQASRDMEATVLATLKDEGMEVTEVSEAERARMRDKLQPVIEKYAGQVDQALATEMFAEIARIRGNN